ncbi:hypothetical protein [Ornithinimicrobium kibberense]|uniref:hypothetical protein n=1 Tax=Ornithinimicrobium kibberense TaxID=282060 RepID=UPI003613662D
MAGPHEHPRAAPAAARAGPTGRGPARGRRPLSHALLPPPEQGGPGPFPRRVGDGPAAGPAGPPARADPRRGPPAGPGLELPLPHRAGRGRRAGRHGR